MELVFVNDGLEEVAKENGMTVEQIKEHWKECSENDPKAQKLNQHRYHLQDSTDRYIFLWDSLKKEHITIRGEKKCEKWLKEHCGEWCTDF